MSEGASPRITIGLLTWNGRATLPACLESLVAQTLTDWELVVVDNGSRDGSGALVAGWCARNLAPQSWQLLRHRHNRGYAAGMNAIANRARGVWLLALNQDVALHPEYLERICKALEDEPSWVGAIGRIERTADLEHRTETGQLDSTGHLLFRDRIVMNRTVEAEAGPVFGLPGMCPVFRRTALKSIRMRQGWIWDERFFAYLEDVDLDYRWHRIGAQVGYVPEAHAWHQPHGSGGRATFGIRFRAHMNRYRILAKHETWPSLAPDWGPILAQELWQFVRTTGTNPLLHLSAIPFAWQWLLGWYREPGPRTPPDRRWITPGSRWGR